MNEPVFRSSAFPFSTKPMSFGSREFPLSSTWQILRRNRMDSIVKYSVARTQWWRLVPLSWRHEILIRTPVDAIAPCTQTKCPLMEVFSSNITMNSNQFQNSTWWLPIRAWQLIRRIKTGHKQAKPGPSWSNHGHERYTIPYSGCGDWEYKQALPSYAGNHLFHQVRLEYNIGDRPTSQSWHAAATDPGLHTSYPNCFKHQDHSLAQWTFKLAITTLRNKNIAERMLVFETL